MSALVKKEIRLLLPIWIGTLLLVVLTARLLPANVEIRSLAIDIRSLALGVCCIVLAAASYGMEFTHGTFSLLLSQPASRARIWKVKAFVLAAALLTVASAFALCQKLTATRPLDSQQWLEFSFILSATAVAFSAAILLRQIFAAFWLAWSVSMAVVFLSFLALTYFWKTIGDPSPFLYAPLLIAAAVGILRSY